MKAIQLVRHGNPGELVLREVPVPAPGPKEVVVQVRACGLNRLDLWLEEAGLPVLVSLPRIPGGEIAGTVLEAGPGVRAWEPGDRVAVQSNIFCGECEFCLRGEESLCLKGELLGVTRDGGFAEAVSVPAKSLVRLPAAIDFVSSAALTLAGSTAMHMLTDRAKVNPGDWVLVMAAGSGVGAAAIQIARQFGARVITTGSTEAKRGLGTSLGAEHALDPAEPSWPATVRQLTGKRGVDLVIEHVGGPVLAQCFECLVRGGTVVTCGATAGRDVLMHLWPFFVKQHRLVGSYGRNRADVVATLDSAAMGTLAPVIDSTFPLDRAPEAFARLRSREALGKIVITVGQ